jgi:hypothetical protein
VKFWFLTLTSNQELRLVKFKMNLGKTKNKRKKTAAASLSRRRTTGCSKRWRITNLGTASRKEHKYSYCCWTTKRYEKK